MTTIILAILLALGISWFSIQNTHAVTMTLANYPLTGIPLYIIVLASLLIGLCIGFLMNALTALSSMIKIHGKDSAVRNAISSNAELKRELEDAQLENKLLREQLDQQYTGTDTPPLFTRLRHNTGL